MQSCIVVCRTGVSCVWTRCFFLLWFFFFTILMFLRHIDYKPSADRAVISTVPSVLFLSIRITVNEQFEIQVYVLGHVLNYNLAVGNVTEITSYFIFICWCNRRRNIPPVIWWWQTANEWRVYWLGTRMNLHCNKDTGLSLCPLGELC